MQNCSVDRGDPHRFIFRAFELDPLNPLLTQVGDWIASGKVADVHELDDGRVIRIARCSNYDWKLYAEMLERFRNNPHPVVVRVYDFGKWGEKPHEEFPGEVWVYYYTITEKLVPITDETEGEAICTLLNEALNGGESLEPTNNIISEIEASRVRESLSDFPFSYVDLHWGNVMKDASGKYKLVDLDNLE